MKRKVIHICCALSEATGSIGRERLYALADDGTIWGRTPRDNKGQSKWEMIEAIPDRIEKLVSEPLSEEKKNDQHQV